MRPHYGKDPIASAAPVVPDSTLDALGEMFLAHGGERLLGSFEAFVWAHQGSIDPRTHARAMQRRAIDQRGRPA